MAIRIIDHIRDGCAEDNTKPNDDWIGFNDHCAIVADGATGLSDQRLVNEADSDAQWIAKKAVDRFLASNPDDPVRDLVREINSHARETVFGASEADIVPRYAWPGASFIMARLQANLIEISGLGDCVAFVEFSDGFVDRFSALPFNRSGESASAKADLTARKTVSEAIRSPEVIESLRAKRELNNSEKSGVWTLGLVPEAAQHVLTVAFPASEVSHVLLMSDGFSAAVDAYELWDETGFLNAARHDGLAAINAKIRHVERLVDPHAVRFPRYKQSDDSSAILLKTGN
jgi:hypothetical protein